MAAVQARDGCRVSAARQRGHDEAKVLYDSIKFPYWPSWNHLRLRTRDLWAATLYATGYDRDKPVENGNGELPYTPNSNTPAVPPAPHASPARYAAGAQPSADGILLREAGFAPG